MKPEESHDPSTTMRNGIRNGSDPNSEAREALAARLSALPRPTLREDTADRIRMRVLAGLATPPPPRFSFPSLRPVAVGGGILAAFPLSAQIAVAATLLTVAGWMVAHDVQAFPALPWQSAAPAPTIPEECERSVSMQIRPQRVPDSVMKDIKASSGANGLVCPRKKKQSVSGPTPVPVQPTPVPATD